MALPVALVWLVRRQGPGSRPWVALGWWSAGAAPMVVLALVDLTARSRWVEYSMAKDQMFAYTDIKQAPWFVVNADVKKLARLNCIHHLLHQIPYQDLTPEPINLPPRQTEIGYVRTPMDYQTFVPQVYPRS